MPDYYTRDGSPITLLEWCRLFEDKSYQIVRQTWTQSGAFVSTVWLGLDHHFSAAGPPIIFETMVFHDGEDVLQKRYSVEAEALADHDALVAQFGGTRAND